MLFSYRTLVLIIILLTTGLSGSAAPPVEAAINPFPLYNDIKPNVKFWKIVYSRYSSRHGLLHDSKNLAVIYEVIDLYDPARYLNSVKRNRRLIKKAKSKYRRLLLSLAQGRETSSKTGRRILNLFGGSPEPAELRKAANNIRFQLCLKNRFKQGIINSGQYLQTIKQIFRRQHLPTDLAYLPHVESSYNYKAYSKFGAAGIWQFIRATGRRYLTISYTVDERRDPLRSSRAAALFLKSNYRKLNNWPLAITAYNHGARSMQRAQNEYGGYVAIINSYQNRRFGFASRNFYPEFLAAREIAKHYKKYFPNLTMRPLVKTKDIRLPAYINPTELARFLSLPLQSLKSLNPAIRAPVWNGQKYIPAGYRLHLPADIHLSAAQIPVSLYRKTQKRSRFYRVERGDTAGRIARRQRVRLQDLLDYNQLGRRATIYVGQNLRIPVPGDYRPERKQRFAALKIIKPVAENVITASRSETNAKSSAAINEAVPATVTTPEPPLIHTTVPTPTTQNKPASLTNKPPPIREPVTPSRQLLIAMLPSHLNGLDNNNVLLRSPITPTAAEKPALEVPPGAIVSINPEVLTGNFEVEKVLTLNNRKIGIIQVEESETLGHYADWLQVRTQMIRNLNHISFRHRINTHDHIKIPLDKVGKDRFEELRYEFHKEIAEDFFAAYKITGVQSYQIKRGDNIWTICHEVLDLPLWLMKEYNPSTSFENLRPGQRLNYPVVISSTPAA
ncbi:transglycosylase SLT domain-containing protein [Desulfobacterota bacterium M19]